MMCTAPDATPDWKAYALGELDAAARWEAEAHAAVCAGCRDELAALRVTLDALSVLREEEIPRRIGFVSDKVFEPHWWQRAFRLTFANPTFSAACVVAAAILVHAFVRSGDAVVQAQIDAAVTKAVAQVETRHAQERAEMLAASELMQKYATQMYVVSNGIVRQ
ncbi:MAG TPA: zf-HC2 domain-containing protein [Bryobacteraceae bacterium]|nr:zf-HC2 domain-containing protein [Bryobacteraceae bacterium]